MASESQASSKIELYDSSMTVPSDSENYSANNEASQSSASTTSSPLILYKPPTVWSILRGAAINLILPFVNGLMLGFGELFAHEAAYRLGWSGTKVRVQTIQHPDALSLVPANHCRAFCIYRSSLLIDGPDLLVLVLMFERSLERGEVSLVCGATRPNEEDIVAEWMVYHHPS